MRSQKRIKPILKKIEELWNLNEDQRLGQLLVNFGFCTRNELKIWNMEEDEISKNLDYFIKEYTKEEGGE